MGQIITYNNPIDGKPNQCYCQIRFESGERILISQTQFELKVLKLLLGVFPTKTLLRFSLNESIDLITTTLENNKVYPFIMDYFKDKIVTMNSVKEMLEFFKPCLIYFNEQKNLNNVE